MNTTEGRLLHTLRCIGASSVDRIADRVGVGPDEAEATLIDLGARGWVAKDAGTFGGWRVTDAGKVADNEAVAAEVAETGCLAGIEAAYGRFEGLNAVALEACTAFQMRTVNGVRQVNDHTDRAYDTRILRQLASVERRGQEVCNDLESVLDRFADYGPRLSEAMNRALAGYWEYVSEHEDSFHTVWFQLHEDLLVTLGRPRR
ncbi:MAG TPA: transcriptional regulator [Propionibacterium sp.]|nr:transcriptional regulator [Propionibacterium sp.]